MSKETESVEIERGGGIKTLDMGKMRLYGSMLGSVKDVTMHVVRGNISSGFSENS